MTQSAMAAFNVENHNSWNATSNYICAYIIEMQGEILKHKIENKIVKKAHALQSFNFHIKAHQFLIKTETRKIGTATKCLSKNKKNNK